MRILIAVVAQRQKDNKVIYNFKIVTAYSLFFLVVFSPCGGLRIDMTWERVQCSWQHH